MKLFACAGQNPFQMCSNAWLWERDGCFKQNNSSKELTRREMKRGR